MRQIAFLGRQWELASTRYRIGLPAYELQKMGWEVTKEAKTLIFGKSNIDAEILKLYKYRIYDVCDNNFDCPKRGEEYRRYCRESDAVTCNSDAMRFLIHREGGRVAEVIPDPYEHPEWEPSWGDGLMWYGHSVNVKDLVRVIPQLRGRPVVALTNETERLESFVPWSKEAMDEWFTKSRFVIIPTGRNIYKSANRLLEAVRAGKFVVAEPLPAYEEFREWMWIGGIREGLDWADAHKDECLDRVRACQDYIRDKYSPRTIAEKWARVIDAVECGVWQKAP